MSDNRVIVTKEELERLRQLQQNWNILTKRWGENEYERRILEKEKQEILSAIDNLETERFAVTQELQDKYKIIGSIDLDTGEFTPIS